MTAINILISMMDKSDTDPLRNMFYNIDQDMTGFISTQELKDALLSSNLQET